MSETTTPTQWVFHQVDLIAPQGNHAITHDIGEQAPEGFVLDGPKSRDLRRIAGFVGNPHSETLRQAADEIDRLRDALHWCSGSFDFAPEGRAHKGWMKIVAPLL